MKKLLTNIMLILALTVPLQLTVTVGMVSAQKVRDTVFKENCTKARQAGKNPDYCKNIPTQSGDRITGPNGILTKIFQTIVYVTGAVSVIMVIIGGFRYVISAGDPGGTKAAKDTILYALVGLIVAIFAQVIVSFVLGKL